MSAAAPGLVRRTPGFLTLWAGQGLSCAGSEITVLALPLLAALTLGAGPGEVGLLVAAEQAPLTGFGLLVGPLVDRLGPRRVILATDYGRAAVLLLVTVLAVTDRLGVGLLVLAAALLGAQSAAYEVAIMVLVPELVPVEQLMPANARLEGTRAVAQVAGPGLGGLLVQAVGPARALLADVASFAVSAVTVHRLKRVEPPRPAGEPGGAGVRGHLAAIRTGIAVVWRDRRLRLLGLSAGGFNVFVGVAVAVEVFYAVRVVGLEPAALGAAISAGLAGGVVGTLLVDRLNRAVGARTVLVAGLLVAAPGPLLVLAAGWVDGAAAVLVAAGYLANAIGVALFAVTNLSFRQAVVPAVSRGTAIAASRLLSRAGLPVGAALGGGLAALASPGAALLVAAAGQAAAAAALAARRRRLPARLMP
ncbi:MAG: MFS transporter [Mycobacteriales bacterium]